MSEPVYTSEEIETALNDRGELLVVLDSDAYGRPIELHKHDTEFYHEKNEVILQLSDGELAFRTDSVESLSIHQQSTNDYGL